MPRRIARNIFWLALISAASQHDVLIGLVLYPIAVISVVGIVLTWVALVFGAWLLWYRLRHGRLPKWLTRERLAGLVARLPWRVGITPRQMRRKARSPQPSRPRAADASALDMAICATACSSPAGGPDGEPAWSHLT